MSRTLLVVLLALLICVAAVAVALARHESPRTKLERIEYAPPIARLLQALLHARPPGHADAVLARRCG